MESALAFSSKELPNFHNCACVVDGGHLLHRMVWQQNATYNCLYELYVAYVLRNYGSNSTVVFDGYDRTVTTKCAEQQRRAKKLHSANVLFDGTMKATIQQDKFLSNTHNKARFIEQLSHKLRESKITVTQAVGDADTLIVKTAVGLSEANTRVIVVAEDVDLLVLLIVLAHPENDILFIKVGKGKTETKMYSTMHLQLALKDIKDCLLFLHAVTGCDTTSSPFRQGKKKGLKLLQKREDLRQLVCVLNQENATADSIVSAGEHFLLALYGADDKIKSLNEHRYHTFTRSVARCPIQNQIQLSGLPPTTEAARQHSLRVYHQVQQWLGHDLPPENWGWKLLDNILLPVTTLQAPAPDVLLNLITCNCKSGCERACGCRKAGLQCSNMCGQCRGSGCSNSTNIETEESPPDCIENHSDDDTDSVCVNEDSLPSESED